MGRKRTHHEMHEPHIMVLQHTLVSVIDAICILVSSTKTVIILEKDA